ncbi:hypothetical protein [Sphingobacterium sp. UDSM-2020]|uniref:hypothetical protein n=1 Tax=Sphingobacterium sp. UDSM-2020 TaxID=2795738 RepID=UPI0019353E57|nr:hypothetical protein [Sphingobacterium sp. UDSM-2020]QQD15036.1 hypothetical protein JAZ75_05790 [Sphingobacterium sp. UDSM-2020]
MRALYLLVLIFNLFLLQGDGIVLTNSHFHSGTGSVSSFLGKSPETKIKSSHIHSIFSKALNERTYEMTEDDVEDELVFESHTITVFKNIALLSYALALIFVLKNLKNLLSVFKTQHFTSTNKYILQRVLRL